MKNLLQWLMCAVMAFALFCLFIMASGCADVDLGKECWALTAKRAAIVAYSEVYPGDFSDVENAAVYLSDDIDSDCAPQWSHVAACNISGELYIGTSFWHKATNRYEESAEDERVILVVHEALHSCYFESDRDWHYGHDGTWPTILADAQKLALQEVKKCQQ